MDSRWNKDEEKQINKYNGQYVTATLSFLGSKATENELLKHIVWTTSQPHEVVEQELSCILKNGVGHGFIMKIGNEYLLPTQPNGKFEVDSDVRCLGTIKEEPEDLECENEDEDEDDEEKFGKVLSDYLNQLEEMMKLQCRLFRNKLLNKIIDVVVDEKKRKKPKCASALTNQILHVSTIPEQHVDAFTKNKLKSFYNAAYELIKTHSVRPKLLRYTFSSLDKYLMQANMQKFKPEKQQAIKAYIAEVEQLEKGDCEIFRTVYVNHLLNKVDEALEQGIELASELFAKLNIQDENAEVSCTLKNFVQKSFVLGKLGSCPIEAYFKFLTDRQARAPKRKAGKTRGRGGRKRKRC